MKRQLIIAVATAIQARNSCHEKSVIPNGESAHWQEMRDKWEFLLSSMESTLPSGSGFDNGTKIDLNESQFGKVVLYTSFHHMDENGGYEGWTEHKITVKPVFGGIRIIVGGQNKNDIKEYIRETFDNCLTTEGDWAI